MSFFSWLWPDSKQEPPQTEEVKLRNLLMATVNVCDCVTVYHQALPESALEKDAYAKITKLAHTFNDWKAVAMGISENDPLFVPALEAMLSLAGTCPQMEAIVRLCPHKIPVHAKALEVLAKKAQSFDDWLLVFSLAPSESDLSKRAETEVEKHATTLGHWEEIYNKTSDPVLETKALEMRLAKSDTLSELSELYTDVPEGSPLEKLVAEKFARVDASFKELLAFYEHGDDDQNKHKCLTEIILKRLLTGASDHDELISIYDIAHEADDQDEVTLILEELGKRTLAKETWEEIRQNADGASPLENFALRKLVWFCANSVADILGLYIEYLEQTDTDDEVAQDMVNAILDKATMDERRIIAHLAGCGESLDELASQAEAICAPKDPPQVATT